MGIEQIICDHCEYDNICKEDHSCSYQHDLAGAIVEAGYVLKAADQRLPENPFSDEIDENSNPNETLYYSGFNSGFEKCKFLILENRFVKVQYKSVERMMNNKPRPSL